MILQALGYIVYLARINNALSEWMVSFNDHPVQTEHSWSPNQMWLNGMMHPCNPLANGSNEQQQQQQQQQQQSGTKFP